MFREEKRKDLEVFLSYKDDEIIFVSGHFIKVLENLSEAKNVKYFLEPLLNLEKGTVVSVDETIREHLGVILYEFFKLGKHYDGESFLEFMTTKYPTLTLKDF